MIEDWLGQAFKYYNSGRLEEAASAYSAILALDPDHSEANHLLGVICFQQGCAAAARAHLDRATKNATATAEMHNNFGVVLVALEEVNEAAAAFARALAAKPDYAEALNNIGSIHRAGGKAAQAVEAFQRAIALKPDYAEAKANLRAVYRDVIPAWHFAMMNDQARNDAYDMAIRRAVQGKHILDIGTGAGLLAMMAARAEAASVTSCEMVPLIAERAQMIVAENGLSERVTIIGKPSTELLVGRDLPERAEVLVTEIFSSGLLNENILGAMEHAHEYLLSPNASIIPASVSAFAYLVGGSALRNKLYVEHSSGFNLTPFNDFAPPKIGLYLDREPHESLSDDFELIRFDLSQKSFPMTHRQMAVTATKQGACLGVAQWLRLDLDAETSYANRPSPDADGNSWAHIVYRFPKLMPVAPGDIVRLVVRHDRKQLSVDLIE